MHLIANGRVEKMLRITTEKKRARTVLSVEGRLAGAWVATLEQCWRERAPGEKFSVDLCGVSFIDAAGKALLKEIHEQGGKLIAAGCLNQAIVEEIAGRERPEKSACGSRKKGSHIIFYVVFFSLLITPAVAHAQESAKRSLLPGTRADWRAAVDAKSSRKPGAEAESDGADRDHNRCGERARQKCGTSGIAPSGELECNRHRRATELDGIYWEEFPGVFSTRRSFPDFLRRPGIQRAGVRSDPVPALSGGARNDEREQV